MAELGGEKIDVIEWSEDAATFVAKALSPAQVIEVRVDEEHRIANVVVPERMLSLAIGREGQNARLAAKLTGWRIDIRSDVSVAEAAKAEAEGAAEAAAETLAEETPAVPLAAEGPAETAAPEEVAPEAGQAVEVAPDAAQPRPAVARPRPRPRPRRSRRSVGRLRHQMRSSTRRCPRSPGRGASALPDAFLRRLPDGTAEARASPRRSDAGWTRRDRSDRETGRTRCVSMQQRSVPKCGAGQRIAATSAGSADPG